MFENMFVQYGSDAPCFAFMGRVHSLMIKIPFSTKSESFYLCDYVCLVHSAIKMVAILIMRTSNPRQVAPATGAPSSPVTVTAGCGSNLKSTGELSLFHSNSWGIFWKYHMFHIHMVIETLWSTSGTSSGTPSVANAGTLGFSEAGNSGRKTCKTLPPSFHLHFTFISNFPGCPKDVQPCSTYEASSVSKKPRVAVVTCTN